MIIRDNPDDCTVHEYVPRAKVMHWPKMSDASAVAFKRFVGKHLAVAGDLFRKGPRIFVIGDADLAVCVYNHTRQF